MNNKNFYLDHRIVKTKEALKNALLALLKYKKFEEITVTEITKKANLNRGSFYNHYQTIENLLNELIDEYLNDLIEAYRIPYQTMKPFVISKLNSSSVELFNNVYNHSAFYLTMAHSNISFHFRECLYNALKKVNLTELRVYDSKIESEFIASYLAFAIGGLIIDWVEGSFKHTPEHMASQLLELMKISPKQTFRVQ